ncbi:4Fe-4S dicluster domain-containing protein [Desulfonispora thiosulfatigenes]|nr:4Fe-4S dicluster domain-containing protein [Desulfonispora thiosulfatigenes]
MTKKMREVAKELLSNGDVKVIIGWEKGTFPNISCPAFIDKPEDVERLVWDDYCHANLSSYLLDYRKSDDKIGIFVKGCDSRGVNRLLQDLQATREKIYVIGIPCTGLKDSETNEKPQKCVECRYPNPLIYDKLIGEEQKLNEVAATVEAREFKDVKGIEAMNTEEKNQFWEDNYSSCIRCYACRNICSACNCTSCIFDTTATQGWIGKANNVDENKFFALTRAFHVAGRCVECGECERVCPMNIPIMSLNRKLTQDIGDLFGEFDAGVNVESPLPLGHFDKLNDPEEFK